MLIRLDRFVSEACSVSRQDAKRLISSGCVKIDGQVVKKSDYKAQDTDILLVNGTEYKRQEFVYVMLNKPTGVVSVSRDKNDVTVTDLVAKSYPKRELFPAGRLDKDSTGFILLTDDGKFAHDILSPKHHVPKTYIVTLDASINDEIVESFNQGVTLADGTMLKSAVLERTDIDNVVKVIIKQGVYHQIKRMFGVFSIGVNELHRTHIGNLALDDSLADGEFRELSEKELLSITKL